MSHFAIVGGAGFIGSHFIERLLESGQKVSVIDNLTSGSLDLISCHFNSNDFSFFQVDARETAELEKIFRKVDVVLHLASNPDISKAESYPRIDFENGTMLTESVLEATRLAGVKKFLYASGSGVYSNDDLNARLEDDKLEPISTYGASKLAGEALTAAYSYMFGIQAISFRFANVVGPRQTHGVGYDFIRKLRNDPSRLMVLGNGTQTKSYIDVHDVISGVLLASEKCSKNYDVFNVSTNDLVTVNEIVEIVISEYGLERHTVEVTFGEGDRGWKADVPKIKLDSSKLRKLGWGNNYSSRSAIVNAVRAMILESD
jgi:UDP-glucose 4-epimerase